MTHVCGPACFNKIQYFRLPVITTKQARVGYMAKNKAMAFTGNRSISSIGISFLR